MPLAEQQARAELYLCLSRAFLTPRAPGYRQALAEALPADLTQLLGDEPAAGHLDALREAAEAISDDDTLLKGYTALFLTPPYRVPINAGIQLDGAIAGGTSQAIEAFCRRYGMARSAGFKDLPDHLAAELELAAYLLATAETEAQLADLRAFLGRYVASWLPRMIEQLDAQRSCYAAAALYQVLARITLEAIDADRARLPAPTPEQPTPDPEEAAIAEAARQVGDEHQHAEVATVCVRCGEPLTLQGGHAAVFRRLEAAGAPTEHLAICSGCTEQGLGRPAPAARTPSRPRPARKGTSVR